MLNEEFREELECFYENSMLLESPEFDSAVIGFSTDDAVVYSISKMADQLCKEDGIDFEDAVEYIYINVVRALPFMASKGIPPILVDDIGRS